MSDNPLRAVQDLGQSLWYDNIHRAQLADIRRMVENDGILGVTSNPTIFMKAIAGGPHYDDAIAEMLDLDAGAIYESLAVADIRAAADILQPVYEHTEQRDGYVSLEVSPRLANSTEQTISEARRLFEAVDRPNVMIKIPATEAGLPAIEESIAEGINVNITLIFSVDNYREVAERYIRGLERRQTAGQPVTGIASVASFFVSRIDTTIDQQLENNIRMAQANNLERVRMNRELLGTIAIANAKRAYHVFKEIFYGERFAALHAAGAQVQRPLWASTGTQNPAYSPTLYVDALIGQDTVNTLPPHTLEAFKTGGIAAPTLDRDLHQADMVLDKLAEVGIDLDSVTRMLQLDGVDAFADSFEKLLQAVEGKREMLQAGVIRRQRGIVGGHEPGVRRVVKRLEHEHANTRIWERDVTFWKEAAQHHEQIRERLGWLDPLSSDRLDLARLQALQAEASQWQAVVLLGAGGSSLMAQVLAQVFGPQHGYPEMYVLDTTEPAYVQRILEAITLDKTLFVVASKTGQTPETDALYHFFYQKTGETGGQFIAITDEGSSLAEQAEDFRQIFYMPSDLAGRYAALSYIGLVPAALLGLDLERLLASARQMLKAIGPIIPAQGHPGIWLGALMGHMAMRRIDKLVLICSEPLAPFAAWIEQMVAESLGKQGTGIVPIVSSTIGYPHDYDDDRFIVHLRLDDEAPEVDAQVQQLWEAGHPVFILHLSEVYDLGGEFLRWSYATTVAAHILGVNPYDEPNVQESKDQTQALLDTYMHEGMLPETEPFYEAADVALYVAESTGEILTKICAQRNYSDRELAGILAAHISFARSGDYIALMAYMEPTAQNDALLKDIQRRLRHATTRAVMLGYGPRLLHATGQLHKGGPPHGLFIQLTVEDSVDFEVPQRPYTLGVLKQAQAMGDRQALEARDLPFVRLHIKGDIPAGLERILEAVQVIEEKQI